MADCFLPADICEDLLCCVICYEPFTGDRVPKALPCLHCFCSDCLHSAVQAYRFRFRANNTSVGLPQPDSPGNSPFPCPVCKVTCLIPPDGISGFPDDFRILRLSEVLFRRGRSPTSAKWPSPGSPTQLRTSKRMAGKGGSEKSEGMGPSTLHQLTQTDSLTTRDSSQVCSRCNSPAGAPLYCLECSKLLGRNCPETHMSSSTDHFQRLLNSSMALPYRVTTCVQHAGEPLHYYCHTCTQPVCMVCTMTDDHVEHDVTCVTKESVNINQDLDKLLDTCMNKISKVHSTLEELEILEKRLEEKQRSATEAILTSTFEQIPTVQINQVTGAQQAIQQRLQHSSCPAAHTFAHPGSDHYVNFGHYEALEEQQTSLDTARECTTTVHSRRHSTHKVEPLKVIGRRGSADGEFDFPAGVAVLPNGHMVVADMRNNRIQVFDADGNFLRKFGRAGFKPCGIAVTRSGDIAVTDCKTHVNCIKVFTPEGRLKQQLGHGKFSYPFSLAVDGQDRFVVSDPAVGLVTVLWPDGAVHSRFSTGSRFPFYVAVNSRDEILISDWHERHIKVFDPCGRLLRRIGRGGGRGEGQLMVPLGLVCDGQDRAIVIDCQCERATVFTAAGRFVRHFAAEDLQHARAVALSPKGHLVVTIGDNKRDTPNKLLVFRM